MEQLTTSQYSAGNAGNGHQHDSVLSSGGTNNVSLLMPLTALEIPRQGFRPAAKPGYAIPDIRLPRSALCYLRFHQRAELADLFSGFLICDLPHPHLAI